MDAHAFPLALDSYGDAATSGLWEMLVGRVKEEPLNFVATAIFVAAILHTFLAARFRHWAHEVEEAHCRKLKAGPSRVDSDGAPIEVSFWGQILHFLGEVEAVFGIWAVVLLAVVALMKGWGTAVDYIGHEVNFTEPMFVVVIMALASTRPVLQFAERCLQAIASLGRGTVGAWWLTLLILAPLLGSFITEPAAMTIAAILLGRMFYSFKPSPRLAYATLGLLFVNVSIGGTLTHFAAPPVLMVATPWKWNTVFMLTHFGWKAVAGIATATVLIYFVFRGELAALELNRKQVAAGSADQPVSNARPPAPGWVIAVQIGFMAWTVFVAHYPALFVGGFLFYLAFAQATAHHQDALDLRPSLLVGFFLAGLVIHGGLQGWWIQPLLSRMGDTPLFLGATGLTAFNDNAAITYLATLVPSFSETAKYAVVAGAVTGGGLTVIANAPNPAGQSILQRYFPEGISPLGLFMGALFPTVIAGLFFALF
ncbi:MAG: putative Na+/H+ antiporter [Nibricoccus sp.]